MQNGHIIAILALLLAYVMFKPQDIIENFKGKKGGRKGGRRHRRTSHAWGGIPWYGNWGYYGYYPQSLYYPQYSYYPQYPYYPQSYEWLYHTKIPNFPAYTMHVSLVHISEFEALLLQLVTSIIPVMEVLFIALYFIKKTWDNLSSGRRK